MKKAQIVPLYDQVQRIDQEYPGMRREVTPKIVRHIDRSESGGGMISFSQLNESDADDVIRAQMEYFEGIGQDFEWKLYDYDRPPDLMDRLVEHGFTVGEAEAIMVLSLGDAPGILQQPVQHDVRRITTPGALADVLAVEQHVWGEDLTSLGNFLEETLRKNPDQLSVYVAYMNQRPASAAWIYFPKNSQFASLWGGSTLEAFRNQGLYTALLAVRMQEARAREIGYLTVDASNMSRPILEKFGFEMIAFSYPCKWTCRSK